MSSKSKIEWTESTWNPTAGCTKCSPGCDNCYAERMARRLAQIPGSRWKYNLFRDGWGPAPLCCYQELEIPLHWKKPRRIFVCSMSDLFHPKVPFEFIEKVWKVASKCCGRDLGHTFLFLTKRPQQMLKFTQWLAGDDDISIAEWPHNCHLGVSICNQKEMDEKWPILRTIPAAVKFISFEPTLSLIDCNRHYWRPIIETSEQDPLGEIVGSEPEERPDWAVIGCESGPKRREMKELWMKILVEQHQNAQVPVFVKQLSINGKVSRDMNQWPEWARVRQYPK